MDKVLSLPSCAKKFHFRNYKLHADIPFDSYVQVSCYTVAPNNRGCVGITPQAGGVGHQSALADRVHCILFRFWHPSTPDNQKTRRRKKEGR